MLRSVVYVDSIIGSTMEQADNLRKEWGNLMQMVPWAVAAHDILYTIGIPADGIRLILGPEMASIDPSQEPVTCQYCTSAPARHLVCIHSGWRLACDACADEARKFGLQVVTPNIKEAVH